MTRIVLMDTQHCPGSGGQLQVSFCMGCRRRPDLAPSNRSMSPGPGPMNGCRVPLRTELIGQHLKR